MSTRTLPDYARAFEERTGITPVNVIIRQNDPMDDGAGFSTVFIHEDVEVLHVPFGNPTALRCHRFLNAQERTFGIRLNVARVLQENIALLERLNDSFGYDEAVSRLLKEIFLADDQQEKSRYIPIQIMQKLRDMRGKIAAMVFDELDDVTVANMQKLR